MNESNHNGTRQFTGSNQNGVPGAGREDNRASVCRGNPVKNILFVDDEEPYRLVLKKALEKYGYVVRVAANGDEGLRLFRERPADLVITDIFMPEKNGHVLISEIMQEFPETNIVAITGYKSYDSEMELDIAETLGAKRVLNKPFKIADLLNTIKEFSIAPPPDRNCRR